MPRMPAAARRRRTNAERTAETRGRLLDAAVECLVELGYRGTTNAEVCRRAGVSRGALLHHFPAKAGLFAAAIEHLFRRRHAEVRAVLAEGGAESLEAAFQTLWEVYSGPTLGAWLEVVVAARTDPELRTEAARVNEAFVAEVAPTFREVFDLPGEVPVEAGLRMVFALLDGLALNHVLARDDALAGRVLEVFEQLLRPWRRGEPGGSP